VVATARRPEFLSDLEADDVLVLGLDVTREEAIEPALDAAVERFGRVDVLVNNAGVRFVGALEEASLADLREVMETMFFGPAALARAVVPRMRAQASGAIVQISSQGGQVTAPGFSAYCAAKFALEGLSEALATEVAPFGVGVLIVEHGRGRGDPREARSAPGRACALGRARTSDRVRWLAPGLRVDAPITVVGGAISRAGGGVALRPFPTGAREKCLPPARAAGGRRDASTRARRSSSGRTTVLQLSTQSQ
jgi:NAD(P)-dependent dehydrogenase (short-subunit alcohol dehydrogenase family)